MICTYVDKSFKQIQGKRCRKINIVDHILVFLHVCVCIYQHIYLFVFFSLSSFFSVHIGDCISEGSFNSWQNSKEGVEISHRYPVPTHGRALERRVAVLHQLPLQVFLRLHALFSHSLYSMGFFFRENMLYFNELQLINNLFMDMFLVL